MCLSTVYIKKKDQESKIMQDVARIEAQNSGFLLISLLGEQKFVKGEIRNIDFVDRHSVLIEQKT